jgi:hypothetical protein
MREWEPERVVALFQDLGVPVQLMDPREELFKALKGDPEEKREIGATDESLKRGCTIRWRVLRRRYGHYVPVLGPNLN